MSHHLDFFDVPLAERWRRVELPNDLGTEGTFEITRARFELFESWFEPLGPEECVRPGLDDGP